MRRNACKRSPTTLVGTSIPGSSLEGDFSKRSTVVVLFLVVILASMGLSTAQPVRADSQVQGVWFSTRSAPWPTAMRLSSAARPAA